MNVGPRASCKTLEEVSHKFRLQITDKARPDFAVDGEGCAPAKIDGGNGKRLVHRHEEVTGAQDSAPVAERTIEGFAKRNANVFDSMMLIDVEIAIAFKFQVKRAVTSKQLKHVVEEPDAGGNLVLSRSFNREFDRNARFGGVARKGCSACGSD
jgi:hypothetical protein